MKFFIFLLIFLSVISICWATPTEQDRTKALELMYSLSSDQLLHFRETSNYQSTTPLWYPGGLITQACAYSTINGKGFIMTVSKAEQGKVYIIQRHEGEADALIQETWTCMNCNGQHYDIVIPVNEHGFCSIVEGEE